jgi:hypothetical protein
MLETSVRTGGGVQEGILTDARDECEDGRRSTGRDFSKSIMP